MRINNFFKLVIAIAVSESAGIIGAVLTTPAINGWYAALIKPALNPPAWVFGPVWIALYAFMGSAFFFVWKQHTYILENMSMLRVWRWAVFFFFIQLALNTLWSIIFFGLHSPGAAFVEIIFLWLAILAAIITFAKISRPAAWLLAPYILWISFASYLNFMIWMLN